MRARWPLGLIMLAGPLAWSLHLAAAYVVSEALCLIQWPSFTLFGLSGPRWILLVASLALLAAVAFSLRIGRRLKASLANHGSDRADRSRLFVVQFSLLSNAVFLFIIAVESIPIFAWMRTC